MSWSVQSAVRLVVSMAAIAMILAIPVVVVHAQEAQEPSPTPAPTPTPEPTPIPATEIPGRATAVGSLLRRAVADTDIGAAIEIPFPQRDLHLRSVDADVAERLSGREPKKNENVPE